jgi:hypothetical protein
MQPTTGARCLASVLLPVADKPPIATRRGAQMAQLIYHMPLLAGRGHTMVSRAGEQDMNKGRNIGLWPGMIMLPGIVLTHDRWQRTRQVDHMAFSELRALLEAGCVGDVVVGEAYMRSTRINHFIDELDAPGQACSTFVQLAPDVDAQAAAPTPGPADLEPLVRQVTIATAA